MTEVREAFPGRRGPRGAAARAVRAALLAAAMLPPCGAGCSPPPQEGRTGATAAAADAGASRRVVVIQNLDEPASRRIAAHYLRRRGLPSDQLCAVSAPAGDEIAYSDYLGAVEAPVRRFLARASFRDSVDFLVTTRGIPLRVAETGSSVDALLGAMDLSFAIPRRDDPGSLRRAANSYFGQDRPFSRREFGFYLVARLDGPDERAARSLVDRARAAAPARGPFLLDVDPRRDDPQYGPVNRSMRRAARLLDSLGYEVTLDTTTAFLSPREPLAGYYSWGSNDGSFTSRAYRALRFLPGSIAETAVSTSGRTFRPTSRGQSRIADLVASGLTGGKGYVSEPLAVALCPADILFERYARGYTLAESFGMATPYLKWKDIVVGDPLCAPYAGR